MFQAMRIDRKCHVVQYAVMTDANIFEHVLKYLRTGVLPIFYDSTAGHNFPLYQALLEESKYFGIDRLEKWLWLCERKYLEAVKIEYMVKETQDRNSCTKHTTSWPNDHTSMLEDRFIEITAGSNTETTILPMTVQLPLFHLHITVLKRVCSIE